MNLLSVDASARECSVAYTKDGAVIAEYYQNRGLTHSVTLMPMVEALLRNCGAVVSDMDAFAVSAGPGSFTGLRIGVSTVKGLAMAAGKECIAVSTLAAIAHPASFFEGAVLCPVMDARANQVYNALFLAEGETIARLEADRAIGVPDLLKALSKETRPVILLGDGALLCYDYVKEAGPGAHIMLAPEPLRRHTALGVALAARRFGVRQRAADLRPEYLRLPQAERERLDKMKEGQER